MKTCSQTIIGAKEVQIPWTSEVQRIKRLRRTLFAYHYYGELLQKFQHYCLYINKQIEPVLKTLDFSPEVRTSNTWDGGLYHLVRFWECIYIDSAQRNIYKECFLHQNTSQIFINNNKKWSSYLFLNIYGTPVWMSLLCTYGCSAYFKINIFKVGYTCCPEYIFWDIQVTSFVNERKCWRKNVNGTKKKSREHTYNINAQKKSREHTCLMRFMQVKSPEQRQQ